MIFNAQRTGVGNVQGDLTFDRVEIDIGSGFDGSSGIFKVPISGIYKMTFSGASAFNKNDPTIIRIYKNGSYMFAIYDCNEAENADENNVSYTWMMKLVNGDQLKLYSDNYLYADANIPLTFTGELIHIEH